MRARDAGGSPVEIGFGRRRGSVGEASILDAGSPGFCLKMKEISLEF